MNDEQIADDFAVGESTVNGVRWWGSFFDDFISTPDTDLFTVTIYGDDGGLPDLSNPALFSSTFNDAGITRTATTLFDIADGPVYQFDVAIPDLALSGGTYYLAVDYEFDAFEAEFFWLFSNRDGPNFFRFLPDPFEVIDPDDDPLFGGNLSFEILGEVVAIREPASLGLLLLGLGLLAVATTRRRGIRVG